MKIIKCKFEDSEIELLEMCPICDESNSTVIYNALDDVTSDSVKGFWALRKCFHCDCLFLNPRPKFDSIGKAYKNYHTHDTPSIDKYRNLPTDQLSIFALKLANGYYSRSYLTDIRPRSRLGYAVVCLFPPLKNKLDLRFRYLPKMSVGKKVLDVGFGGGKFLRLISSAGWEAKGVDFDPEVVRQARASGLDVKLGGISEYSGEKNSFAAITMNHVIEHLHDPMTDLRCAFQMIAPGGRIFVDTPNSDSVGHKLFGRHWRGIEAPRHLVLFNLTNLKQCLARCGFVNIRVVNAPEVTMGMFAQSEKIREKSGLKLSFLNRWYKYKPLVKALRCFLRFVPSRREFISIVAEKPHL